MAGLPALLDYLDHPVLGWIAAGLVIIGVTAFVAKTVDELRTNRHKRVLAETEALLKLQAAKQEASRYERDLAAELRQLEQERAEQQTEMLQEALAADALLREVVSPLKEAFEHVAAEDDVQAAELLSELREAQQFVIESRDKIVEPWLEKRRAESAECQAGRASGAAGESDEGDISA